MKKLSHKELIIAIVIILFIIVMSGAIVMTFRSRENERKEPKVLTMKERYEQVASSLVKVSTETEFGSGVIYRITENSIVIATASHILQSLTQVKVTLPTGEEYDVKDMYLSETADLAFLKIEYIPNDASVPWIEEVMLDQTSFDTLEIGSYIYVGSCPDISIEMTMGKIKDPWIYMEDFGLNMMWCEMEAIPGMSGGGVFDKNAQLIGIICGGTSEGELAVLPLSIMESEWSLSGY